MSLNQRGDRSQNIDSGPRPEKMNINKQKDVVDNGPVGRPSRPGLGMDNGLTGRPSRPPLGMDDGSIESHKMLDWESNPKINSENKPGKNKINIKLDKLLEMTGGNCLV